MIDASSVLLVETECWVTFRQARSERDEVLSLIQASFLRSVVLLQFCQTAFMLIWTLWDNFNWPGESLTDGKLKKSIMLDWTPLTDEVFVGSCFALLWNLIPGQITVQVLWLWLLRCTSICFCCCHLQDESLGKEELWGVGGELQIKTREGKGRVKMKGWKWEAKCKIYESAKEEE